MRPAVVADPDLRLGGPQTLSAERVAQLRTMITRMKQVRSNFYREACAIGTHPFIEFAGLLGEYIKICEDALAADQDFAEASVHTGNPLPMQPYHARYLGEKLGCIYGPSFAHSPELLEEFLATFLGRESKASISI